VDPNPIKHVGSLLRAVRERVEPQLLSAGFTFVERNNPAHPGDPRWLDYQRGEDTVSVRYEPHVARLVAEALVGDSVQDCVVTDMNQPRSAQQLQDRIDAFVAAVAAFIARL
jgi:hypothetical protein